MNAKQFYVCAILIFSAGVAWAQPGERAAPVVAARVKEAKLRATSSVVGTANPETESTVASETLGLVEELPVESGEAVKKGQLICKLRNSTIKLFHTESLARLEGLKQQLAELEAGTRKEDLDRFRAVMKESKALADKWDREMKRIERLYQQKNASIKEYQDTLSEFTAAKQRLAQAEAELAKAVAGPRKEELARARAMVEAQTAVAGEIQDRIDKTYIKAPFDGIITKKLTEVGEWMTIGGPVADVIATEVILARVDVPERAIRFVKKGDPAEVWIDALQRQFPGKVVHIIPLGDPAARTFPVEIEIDNRKELIKAGMFVRAKLPAGEDIDVLVVPKDAIVRQGPTRLVYAIRNGLAIPVVVETGLEELSAVAVFGELKAGELVVVRGNEFLMPGQAVKITNEGILKTPSSQPKQAEKK
jgi:multidrug efflux pump subunit AcrA (membrane-fusion protein)